MSIADRISKKAEENLDAALTMLDKYAVSVSIHSNKSVYKLQDCSFLSVVPIEDCLVEMFES
ncbi:hypothetical protein VFMJ11_B0025 (plasmid) [Aliivibrio fischeri MJ11]|uniref:Uncharacterized protein n=1 Tax=Aliivibrio fischeri (strain MJ11) TaxID=388396 RepID=B5EVW8_ALIFM|nr:hypothetical protein [Aliivibrio fischeri]ACH64798.1 hypothetical protein VFMJ11_B0025 [Aliivibrio fischeri MJ11]